MYFKALQFKDANIRKDGSEYKTHRFISLGSTSTYKEKQGAKSVAV